MKFVNEKIEDVLKPKNQEEIEEVVDKNTDTTQNFIFRVYSGVDAFVLNKNIFLPYIDIITYSKQNARELVAELIGQKLEDQDTNDNYTNYVSDHVDFIGKF